MRSRLAWRQNRLHRRQAFAAHATAIGQNGPAALAGVARKEPMLPPAADFRRLILAFHKNRCSMNRNRVAHAGHCLGTPPFSERGRLTMNGRESSRPKRRSAFAALTTSSSQELTVELERAECSLVDAKEDSHPGADLIQQLGCARWRDRFRAARWQFPRWAARKHGAAAIDSAQSSGNGLPFVSGAQISATAPRM